MNVLKSNYNKFAIAMTTVMMSSASFAQEAAEEGTEAVASGTPGFLDIVFGGSIVDIGIWMMIFAVSIATLALIIQGLVNIKHEKMLPEHLIEGIRESLSEGDLGTAVAACEANPGPLSNILMAGFGNITEGFEVIQDSITASADMETEKVMQQVNYLNICGQIAPMLGLMGTVTGMVAAFGGLATASAATKAAVLASSISGALWTTCAGLIIAVPALLGYTLIKNSATRIILETEGVVIDLVKVLRGAEVEEED